MTIINTQFLLFYSQNTSWWSLF